MELPITRPSMISYADELDFDELLGKLKSKKYNGFIRVTAGSEEGHILFKEGIQVAASYDTDSKIDAINKIKSATDNSSTLIEVFDLRDSQIKYLMDINKKYIFNSGSEVQNMLDELKTDAENKEIIESPLPEKPEIIESSLPEEKPESLLPEKPEIKKNIKVEPETQDNNENVRNKLKSISERKDPVKESEIKPGNTDVSHEVNTETSVKEDEEIKAEDETKSIEAVDEPIDRAELMKKYGLKDVGEEEVENILDSYKGGSLSDEDVEKIELTLMNKVKKSILSIPKIKGTEVMVFLDNTSELAGTINIITEYESKGFLSRFMGESKDLDNLKKQIINITQIEIKKSFRGYPEIVDNFKINVEVS